MPCPNRIALRAYMTPEDYQAVKARAGQARLSISTYVQRVCRGQEVKSAIDQEAVLDLLRLKADLGRVGGILKLGLTGNTLDRHRANRLLADLETTRKQIEAKVNEL